MNYRINFYLLALLVSLPMGCSIDRHRGNVAGSDIRSDELEREKYARAQLSKIHEGMTFAEVLKILMLSEMQGPINVMHSGYYCDAPVADGFYIKLRFEHPDNVKPLLDCKLDLPPVLMKSSQ